MLISSLLHKLASTIGDGQTTVYIVEHSFSTTDVFMQVWSDTWHLVQYEMTAIDQSLCRFEFDKPITNYHVIILG
jgi:hypothetical protein